MIVVCPGATGELPALSADMLRRGSLPHARKGIRLPGRLNMMGSKPAQDGRVKGPGGLTAGPAGLAARRARLPSVGRAAEGRSDHAAVDGAASAKLGAEAAG